MDSGRACLFVLGGNRCAVDVRDAREVVTLGTWTRLPGAPPAVLGVLNLRGTIVPLVESRPLLGAAARPVEAGSVAIVLADGALRAAIPVERVLGLESYDDVHAPPATASPLVQGLLAVDDAEVSLLDTPQLLAALRAPWAGKDA